MSQNLSPAAIVIGTLLFLANGDTVGVNYLG